MEQAVRLLYFLSESPDQLCSRLLQRCSRLLLDQIAEGGEMLANKDVSQLPGASQDPEEQGEQGERQSGYLFRKLVHSGKTTSPSSMNRSHSPVVWCSFTVPSVVVYYDDQYFVLVLYDQYCVIVMCVPAVSCVSLAQLLSLCGCVAFWQVSHLERSVSSELQRRD